MKTHVLESLFNKGLQLYEKELPTQMLLVNIAKFLWTVFFIEHLWWVLLKKIRSNFFHSKSNQCEPKEERIPGCNWTWLNLELHSKCFI